MVSHNWIQSSHTFLATPHQNPVETAPPAWAAQASSRPTTKKLERCRDVGLMISGQDTKDVNFESTC